MKSPFRPGSVAEIAVINLICFGPFLVWSALELASRSGLVMFDDRRLYIAVGVELVAGTTAALILRWNGWRFAEFGFHPSLRESVGGAALLVAFSLIFAIGYEAGSLVMGRELSTLVKAEAHVSTGALIASLLINPLYEEFFEVAYNVKALAKHGAAFAISLSATIRFGCHLYQGPIAVVSILPLGILFAVVYWRFGRLWPLVTAHAFADYFGLSGS